MTIIIVMEEMEGGDSSMTREVNLLAITNEVVTTIAVIVER